MLIDGLNDQIAANDKVVDGIRKAAQLQIDANDAQIKALTAQVKANNVLIDGIRKAAQLQIEANDALIKPLREQIEANRNLIDGIREVADAQIAANDLQLDALRDQKSVLEDALRVSKEWASAVKSIGDYITQLKLGNQAPPNPLAQFQLAQANYNAALATFQATPTAAGAADVQKTASDLLAASQLIYTRPSPEYRALFDSIVAQLELVKATAAAFVTPEEEAVAQLKLIDDRIKALTDANTAIKAAADLQVKALEDANKALDKEIQLLEDANAAIQDAADALIRPLEDANDLLNEQVQLLQDANEAIQDAADALIEPLQAANDLLQDQVQALQDTNQAIQDAADALIEPLQAANDLLSEQVQLLQDANAVIQDAADALMEPLQAANELLSDQVQLLQDANQAIQDAADALIGPLEDANDLLQDQVQALQDANQAIQDAADTQVRAIEEQTTAQILAINAAADAQIEAINAQLSLALGQIAAEQGPLLAQQIAAQLELLNSITDGMPTQIFMADRAKETARLLTLIQADIGNLLANGLPPSALSPADPIPTGVNAIAVNTFNTVEVLRGIARSLGVQGFQAGLPYVPSEGLYHLHRGERVLDEEDNALYTAGVARSGAGGVAVLAAPAASSRVSVEGGATVNITIQGYNRDPRDLASELKRELEPWMRDYLTNGRGGRIVRGA